MKLYAPKYYKDFSCIADKCRHSCCIGWEIDIDSEAMEKYLSLTDGYGKEIIKTVETEGCPHFKLKEDDRCPHLDERGLCRIITRLGEDFLCNICREHPRFYNYTPRGKEAGLGLSCEEAARIILSSDRYGEIIEIGECNDDPTFTDFDGALARDRIYSVLRDRSVGYDERLRLISEMYGVYPFSKNEKEWKELLSELEYLDNSHRALFLRYKEEKETPKKLEKVLERALGYFVYRHVSGAESENDLRAALGFSLFCERLLCSLAKEAEEISVAELARIISEELEYSEENTQDIKFEFMF